MINLMQKLFFALVAATTAVPTDCLAVTAQVGKQNATLVSDIDQILDLESAAALTALEVCTLDQVVVSVQATLGDQPL